jgi:hypothetical protein
MLTLNRVGEKPFLVLVLSIAIIVAGCPEGGAFPRVYAENEAGDSIEIVSILPSLPATGDRALDLEERLYVNMRYRLESLDICHIFVLALTDGVQTPAQNVSGSEWLEAGNGETSEWITFAHAQAIDQLLVYMTDDEQDVTLLKIVVDAPVEWR